MKLKFLLIVLHIIFFLSNIASAAKHHTPPHPQFNTPAFPDPSIGSVRNPGSIFPDSSLEARPFIGATPNPSNRVNKHPHGE